MFLTACMRRRAHLVIILLFIFSSDVHSSFASQIPTNSISRTSTNHLLAAEEITNLSESQNDILVDPLSGGTGTGQTAVDVQVNTLIRIASPDQVVFPPPMQIGANSVGGVLNVKCNSTYQVNVFDEDLTDWHMTEWNGSVYGSRQLADPLHVQYPPLGSDISSNTPPQTLITGDVSGQSGDSGQNFDLVFHQNLDYSDVVLPAGENYHLLLTFIGYVTV